MQKSDLRLHSADGFKPNIFEKSQNALWPCPDSLISARRYDEPCPCDSSDGKTIFPCLFTHRKIHLPQTAIAAPKEPLLRRKSRLLRFFSPNTFGG
jgi:hypothetical protein